MTLEDDVVGCSDRARNATRSRVRAAAKGFSWSALRVRDVRELRRFDPARRGGSA